MNLQTNHKKWKPKPLEKFYVYAATTAVFFVVRCVYINPKNASTQFYRGNVQPNPRTFEAATMQFTGSKIESPPRWT
jgi:hypothetical protein